MQTLLQPINTPDNLFHDGNPATGELGTLVTALWLNAVQSATRSTHTELLSLLAAYGVTADPAKTDQVAKLLQAKFAQLADPVFTGKSTAPTAALGDSSLGIANTAFVQAALASVGINGSASKGAFDLNTAPVGSMIGLNGTDAQAATYNWPAQGIGTTPVWYNVLTYGAGGGAGRITQIATSVFSGAGQSRTWVREKHDSTWSAWRELAFLDSPAFTGTPTAPTAAAGTNTHQLATMEALQAGLDSGKGIKTFTANGSWTVPAGVTTIYMSGCAGGGGSAIGFNSSAVYSGGGGGAGQSIQRQAFTVAPGQVIPITIGGGGGGVGAAVNAAGNYRWQYCCWVFDYSRRGRWWWLRGRWGSGRRRIRLPIRRNRVRRLKCHSHGRVAFSVRIRGQLRLWGRRSLYRQLVQRLGWFFRRWL